MDKVGETGEKFFARLSSMTKDEVIQELGMWARGIVASMIAGAMIGMLQYFGAHIPEMITWIGTAVAGFTGVKTTN